jgi:hypothetical protein
MRLTRLKIVNFRGLSNIDFDLPLNTSVIVGPNAIGKSTIFEAIRLLKAILLPTYNNEAQEVLSEMRAWSPMNNAIIVDGILGDRLWRLIGTTALLSCKAWSQTCDARLWGWSKPYHARNGMTAAPTFNLSR